MQREYFTFDQGIKALNWRKQTLSGDSKQQAAEGKSLRLEELFQQPHHRISQVTASS